MIIAQSSIVKISLPFCKKCFTNLSIIFAYKAAYSLVGFIETKIAFPVSGFTVGLSFHSFAIAMISMSGDFALATGLPVSVRIVSAFGIPVKSYSLIFSKHQRIIIGYTPSLLISICLPVKGLEHLPNESTYGAPFLRLSNHS